MPTAVGYIRVSTLDQNVEKNKADILHFANDHDFGKVQWVCETVSGIKDWKSRKLFEVITDLHRGDRITIKSLGNVDIDLSDACYSYQTISINKNRQVEAIL